MTYRIRAPRADELPAFDTIEEDADQRFLDVGLPVEVDLDTLPLAVLEEARRDGRAWVAADDEDRPVGFAVVILLDGQPHLEQVSVLAAHGRRGLGRRLVETAVAWARATGAPSITLSTFRDVAWNGPFYASCCFRTLAEAELSPALVALREHERRIGLPLEARVVMRRDLD